MSINTYLPAAWKRKNEAAAEHLAASSDVYVMANKVYIDGEQIPDDRIRDIFRRPPDVPTTFERSTLLVGSRGAGKTTLFRFLKVSHDGVAIHLALAGDLATFAQDAALGPLSNASSEPLQAQVASKATGILAVVLAGRFIKKRLALDRDRLHDCLPRGLPPLPRRLTFEWCRNVLDTLAGTDLEEFSHGPSPGTLAGFVSSTAEKAASRGQPLLLLLDRADMVVPAALRPVVQLLDQSVHYVALVAIRPGHAASVFSAEELGPVAGDHFSVVHMGRAPYEDDWQLFTEEAVSAQLGGLYIAALESPLKRHVLTLSRDSLRTALELFLACRDAKSHSAAKALSSAIDALRESQIVASQRVLQGLHPDYRRLVSYVRKRAVGPAALLAGPVQVRVSESSSAGLWEQYSRIDALIAAALRSRAACMPNRTPWAPGLRPREFEIPPLVIWSPGDPHWAAGEKSPTIIDLTEGELFSAGGRQPKRLSVFVAYRMDFTNSRRFREELERLLLRQQLGTQVAVTDGRVRDGEDWAPKIRRRIQDARLVAADVTGMRNDVLFELGFAFGLSRRQVPVVETQEARTRVPHWLRSKQIGLYDTDAHLLSVVSSILGYLTDRSAERSSSNPGCAPGLAAWLGFYDEFAAIRDRFPSMAEREGFSPLILNRAEPGEQIIRKATRAHFLVAPLTGGEWDSIIHFICGAIIARPRVGYGTPLARRIALIGPAGNTRGLAADSLLRCVDTVVDCDPPGVHAEIVAAGTAYRKWMQPKR